MKPETRLRRHAQLWESGTSSARRIGISGLIFAILILLRVIEPYHQVELKGEKDMAVLEARQEELLERQSQLGEIETTLREIEDELEKKPWNDEIRSLMKFFVDLRANGYEGDEVPQDRANQTILRIGKMVKASVIDKLRKVTTVPGTSERLAKYPDEIQKALDKWMTDNLDNTEWYFTPESKNETTEDMGEVLATLENEALVAVNESRKSLESDKTALVNSKVIIEAEIKEAELDIEDELYEILPGWMEDSVGVKSMIIFYPWILVAFAVTMVGSAFLAARHFHGMADEEQWTAVERSDPLLSTPWTLTWRGFTGTAVTIVNYLAVILVLGFCIIRAVNPRSADGDGSSAGSESSDGTTVEESTDVLAEAMSSVLPLEFAYGLLITMLVVVVATPAWRRVQKATG